MADFKRAVEFVLAHEGEWSSDPRDPGKRTRWGIASRWYPDVDLDSLTREGAERVYRERYWTEIQGDALPELLGPALLDWAVLQGPRGAIRALQNALGAKVDGIMGPETLAALDATPPRAICRKLLAARKEALLALGNKAFALGWIARVLDLAIELI